MVPLLKNKRRLQRTCLSKIDIVPNGQDQKERNMSSSKRIRREKTKSRTRNLVGCVENMNISRWIVLREVMIPI